MTDAEASRPAGRSFGGWKIALIAALLGALAGAGLTSLWSGRLVRDYILANPEVIPEAMRRLQDRDSARAVAAHRAAIETPFAGAWAGAADGDVVLVEFFDYACAYCRKSNPDVDRLLREDGKLKMVWREWPVLGPNSLAAAEASLVAAKAGRFKDYHDRLFAAGRPTPQSILNAQAAAGISPDQVIAMRSSLEGREELERNHMLARSLNASGTPAFVIGDQLLQGAVGYEALKAAVAKARARP